MKKNIFEVSQEERNRILEMHEDRTSNLYLMSEQENPPADEFNCKSENINITDEPQIRLTTNQEFGDSKSASPNIMLKGFKSTGGESRAPILYVKYLRPEGTATTQQIKSGKGVNKVASADNIWLSKIEYIKIIDKVTKKFVYFPSFLTLTHLFCAKFENAEKLGSFVDVKSAVPGTQVYNYYRFPIISTGTFDVGTTLQKGYDSTGFMDGLLSKDRTFALSKLGTIPQLLFGENFVPSAGFPDQNTRNQIRDIIIENQPKS